MAAIDYRQLSGPQAIDTTPFNDGSAAAATSLSNTFKSFSNTLSDVGAGISADQGAKAGALAGATGDDPGFKDGATQYTAYARAYNNAATRSYAIRAEGDAEETAARLEIQANNDPTHFETTFGAVRDATIAHAPPLARAMVADVYNKRMAEGKTRLITSQLEEFKKEARVDFSEGVSRSTDRISNWQASDDPELHAQAADEQVKLGLMIDGAKGDGTITDTEAASAHIAALRAITEQTVTYRFKNEMNNPYGDPVGFIQRLQDANRTSNVLDPDEEKKLVSTLFETLRQKNALDSFDKRKNGQEEAMRYETGDRTYTGKLLAGNLTNKDLLDAVVSQNLKPEVARTLANELEKGDTSKDDPKVAFDAKTNLLNYSEQEISTMPGLTWKTRGELIEQRRKDADGWKGTQAAREGESRIERALGILPGVDRKTLSPEELSQLNQAKTTYYNEMDAAKPEDRAALAISKAEDVVTRYIRKGKAAEANNWREVKQRYIQKHTEQHGDPGGYGSTLKKTYDAQLKKYDDLAAAAEDQAARK